MARTIVAESLVGPFITDEALPSSGYPEDVLTLDIPTTVGERWLVLASALKRTGQHSSVTVWRVDQERPDDPDGDLTLAQCQERTSGADENGWRAQTLATVFTADTTGTTTMALRAYTVTAGWRIELRDLWLIAVKLTANDLVVSAPGWRSTTSSTYQRLAQLTVPDGVTRNYLGIYHLCYGNDTLTTPSCKVRALQDSLEFAQLNPGNAFFKGQQHRIPFTHFRRLNATGGEVQALEYASTGGGNRVQVHDGLLCLLDLGSFEGGTYAESLNDSAYSGTGWQTKANLPFTGVPVQHLLLASSTSAPRATVTGPCEQLTRLVSDGTAIEDAYGQYASSDAGQSSDYSLARAMIIEPNAGNHTLAWQFSRNAANMTAHLRNASIQLLQYEVSANVSTISHVDRLMLLDDSRPILIEGGSTQRFRDTTLLQESPSKSIAVRRRN